MYGFCRNAIVCVIDEFSAAVADAILYFEVASYFPFMNSSRKEC